MYCFCLCRFCWKKKFIGNKAWNIWSSVPPSPQSKVATQSGVQIVVELTFFWKLKKGHLLWKISIFTAVKTLVLQIKEKKNKLAV